MYSGEYDACDVTLSVYPHRASLKNMPDRKNIPTVVRHIFQACPVWVYTQSNITSIIKQCFFHYGHGNVKKKHYQVFFGSKQEFDIPSILEDHMITQDMMRAEGRSGS